MPKTTDLYSTRQAADYLGLAVTTVKTQYRLGRIPALHIGRVLIFRQTDLDEYRRSVVAFRNRARVKRGEGPTP